MNFVFTFGATPLDLSEADGLIPKHIISMSELNEWEQANILEAELWLVKQTHHFNEIITFNFIQKLHQRMFDKTWKWAGLFRRSNKNIGVDWPQISEYLKRLLDDIEYQVNHKVFEVDEIAARFHHRLVAVHLFPNGNGRHARLMTDILLLSLDQVRFSWGQKDTMELYKPTETRKNYIAALKFADKHDYRFLLEFVRT